MRDETTPSFLCERQVDRIARDIARACTGIGCTMSDETRDALDKYWTEWVWGARFALGPNALDVRVAISWQHDHVTAAFDWRNMQGERVHGLDETNIAEHCNGGSVMSDLFTEHDGLAKARTLLELACASARIDYTLLASDAAACESTYNISFTRREGTHSALVVVRGRDISLWTGQNGEDLFAFLDRQCPKDLGPKIRTWLTGGEA